MIDASHIKVHPHAAGAVGGNIADHIVDHIADHIADHCESQAAFPLRGIGRDDLRPGLCITSYRKRVVIAFAVEGGSVNILGIHYGGQNYEATLLDEDAG